MKKNLSIVGVRPNLMKIAPFIRAIEKYNYKNGRRIQHILIHIGQIYDGRISGAFFKANYIPDLGWACTGKNCYSTHRIKIASILFYFYLLLS